MPDEGTSLAAVAATGNRGATLRALRDKLAEEIETCQSGRDLAALSRQLTLVLSEIANLPDEGEKSSADEIAAKRAARRSATAG
jgi:hypothetical protein